MKDNSNLQLGEVVEILHSAQYRIKLGDGREIRAFICGRMKVNKIRVTLGDKVKVYVSGEIGRIERRL